MKRFTLFLAAFLCLAMSVVNAQTFVGDFEGEFVSSIPAVFTTNGHPYIVRVIRTGDYNNALSIYQSDFATHVVDINNVARYVSWIDLDKIDPVEGYVCATQNLFNSDDYFEYLQYNDNYTQFKIKSTNGSTLWSFNAGVGLHCYCRVLKFDNKYYLDVVEGSGDVYHQHFYYISQSHGLTKVDVQLPISVFPSLVDRGQQITVELGEGNNAKEITVVNGLGQVVKRVPVENGQREVAIPTSDLGSGLNVVNTRTEQGQGSCKIIVR